MKLTLMLAGILLSSTLSATAGTAAPPAGGQLVASDARQSRTAGRIVVCTYVEAGIRYEIVSDTGSCAASLDAGLPTRERQVASLEPNPKTP